MKKLFVSLLCFLLMGSCCYANEITQTKHSPSQIQTESDVFPALCALGLFRIQEGKNISKIEVYNWDSFIEVYPNKKPKEVFIKYSNEGRVDRFDWDSFIKVYPNKKPKEVFIKYSNEGRE